jgi:outer membrane protein
MKRVMTLFVVELLLGAGFSFANSLTLRQAQEMMFGKNLDLAMARQEYCQKDYELSEAKSGWYPSIDASAAYSYQNKKNTITFPSQLTSQLRGFPSGPQEMGTYDRSDLCVDLSYPVTAALVNRSNVRSRVIALKVKNAQDMALKNQLSFKLGLLYLTWDLSFSQMKIRQLVVSQFEATVAHLKNLYEGGMSSSSKILEAQAGLSNARVELVVQENKTDSLKLELNNFIQNSDTSIVPEAYDFNLDSVALKSIDTLSLNDLRPELIALDLSIDQMNEGLDILAGKKYPNLLLNAGYHYGKPELTMSNNPSFMGYAVASVQVKYNIFDGNKIKSQEQQTNQQIQIARDRKQQAVSDFTTAVKSAKMQFLRARKHRSTASLSLDAARAAVKDVKNSLDAGVMTTLDYQNALVAQQTAELSVKQADFFEKTALLKMYFAAGKELKY